MKSITRKSAEELAERMIGEAEKTGSADWDTIFLVSNGDGSYSEGDNGEGEDDLSRDAVKRILINDILLRAGYRGID